jgi:hypothetical protein
MAGKKWSEQTKQSARLKKYGRTELLENEYLKIASSYEDANEFRKVHNKIHTYLRQRNLLDVAFPNRKRYKPKGYWVPDTIREEAKKYRTKTEFTINSQVAFNHSLNYKGLLDDIFPKKEPLNHTFEECQELVKPFKSRMDLSRKNMKLYLYVKDKKWLEKLIPDMRFHKKSKYTIEGIKELAKNYKFISDFVREQPGPYDYAHRNGLIPTLFPERKRKWTDEKIIEELKKYESKRMVARENQSLYNTAQRKGLLEQIFPKHLSVKWTEQRILEELSKYENRRDLYKQNPSLYQIARVGKYLDKHLPNGRKIKWTDEKITEELKKYKNRKEVYQDNFNLYQISLKSGHLNTIHPKKKKVNFTFRP